VEVFKVCSLRQGGLMINPGAVASIGPSEVIILSRSASGASFVNTDCLETLDAHRLILRRACD
jgi:hypothetical protein